MDSSTTTLYPSLDALLASADEGSLFGQDDVALYEAATTLQHAINAYHHLIPQPGWSRPELEAHVARKRSLCAVCDQLWDVIAKRYGCND